MTAHLLDVNVLVALMWPAHEDHQRAQEWFARNSRNGWATCPLTQAGCVRVLSNPAFSRNAVTPQDALKMLSANLSHPSHVFWPDDVSFVEAVETLQKQMVGHQQVSDAYLLGLAMRRRARLATIDRGIAALLPKDKQNVVVIL